METTTMWRVVNRLGRTATFETLLEAMEVAARWGYSARVVEVVS
jgi:hypothetical protein